ncbi:MAG: COX15/CtaA family protein [Halieaceae bacterium]|nr:COX15/CtaA family protein [Halieaceae bacterium]
MALNQSVEQNDRWVARWLTVCAAVIFGMILLGGVTRLTDSGLSMVEWKPIMGIVPPLNEAEWQQAFDKYKQFPEYQKVNQGMDMAGFKVIFMYEYLHRVLGRLIGLLFFLPLVFFAVRGMVRPGLMPKLLGLLFLGGCQGLLGWYMVQSGLVDRPDVSQYRLTAHLGLAVAIYAAMVWVIIGLVSPHRVASHHATIWPLIMVAVVYLMILSGGFVAGTDAGYAYPTWPLMGDRFIPPTLYAEGWISAFEQVTTIHFNHRMFAYLVVVLIGAAVWRGLARSTDRRVRLASSLMLAAVLVQASLGVSTVLSQVAIPIAASHQAGAVLLLTTVIFWAHARRTEVLRSTA